MDLGGGVVHAVHWRRSLFFLRVAVELDALEPKCFPTLSGWAVKVVAGDGVEPTADGNGLGFLVLVDVGGDETVLGSVGVLEGTLRPVGITHLPGEFAVWIRAVEVVGPHDR